MISSDAFAHSPVYEPGRSPRLTAVLALLHATAVVTVLAAPWPWPLELALTTMLAASCLDAVRVHGLRRGGRAWCRIERLADGRWRASRRDGHVVSGRLHADSFVHRWLAIVGIRHGGDLPRPQPFIPVPGDALPAAEHRRLRVWLRWGSC